MRTEVHEKVDVLQGWMEKQGGITPKLSIRDGVERAAAIAAPILARTYDVIRLLRSR
jgi:hypothetical protein